MTEQDAELLAISIESLAKANAMFYVADFAAKTTPESVDPDFIRILDELRVKHKSNLVEVLKTIKRCEEVHRGRIGEL